MTMVQIIMLQKQLHFGEHRIMKLMIVTLGYVDGSDNAQQTGYQNLEDGNSSDNEVYIRLVIYIYLMPHHQLHFKNYITVG